MDELPSTADGILSVCPRFRILVIGKTGVGKSTLINRAFGVNKASVSEDRPGAANIHFEITSEENDKVVIHDSRGFEAGDITNVDVVNSFVRERSEMPLVKDQLHAIWLCAEIPPTGGRIFEKGDEAFLLRSCNSALEVPIIVVFTKYDLLVKTKDFELEDDDDDKRIPEQDRQRLVDGEAEKSFQEDCLRPLRDIAPTTPYVRVSVQPKYRQLLQELVETTFTIVKERLELPSVASAIAQRVSADVKISACISIGKKRYWRALASSADFPGKTLKTCLDVLHRDIVIVWNLRDPESLLLGTKFKGYMTSLLSDMRDQEPSKSTEVATAMGSTVNALASATAALPMVAPLVVPLAVLAGIAIWLAQIYKRSHETIRCLMCYVVDLTLIMQGVFDAQDACSVLTPTIVDHVCLQYGSSSERKWNHTAISNFARDINISDRLSSKRIIDKIEELLQRRALCSSS